MGNFRYFYGTLESSMETGKHKIFHLLILIISLTALNAQPGYNVKVNTRNEDCLKGTATAVIEGLADKDSVYIVWSNGSKDTRFIESLDAGDYSVQVRIRHQQDSVVTYTDTQVPFTIGKELCPVGLPKYFSPNGDNYNDLLTIANIEKYPSFELEIYNKWGQRVHRQTKQYDPWDGNWLGFPLPDGTYYYIVFYDSADKSKFVKGDLTILR